MAKNSTIEWTSHTFNPWWGCTKVSPACDHCYAEVWARRTGHRVWGAGTPRRHLSDQYWDQPLRWDRDAETLGFRARVFCASMADVFEWGHGLQASRKRLWNLIERTPNLDWLLLTKRPHLVKQTGPLARLLARECLAGCDSRKSTVCRQADALFNQPSLQVSVFELRAAARPA